MKEWYHQWFNSPYYHILYKHRNTKEAEEFIDNLIGFIKPKPGSEILDLGCGYGRHSIYLNKKGFKVTGIDISPNSIQKASAYKNINLSFYVHDMKFPFRKNYFDFALNLFTSFGYFDKSDDNINVIKSVNESLKNKGVLVLDFMNSTKVINTLIEEETQNIDKITFKIERNINGDTVEKLIRFNHKNKDYCFLEKVKLLSMVEIHNMMESCEFKIEKIFGNYRLHDFDNIKSDRLIVVGRK